MVQEEQLVAYVVGEANTDVIKAQLATQLPNYMVPEHYVVLEQMPLSANGKLARNALAPISFATSSDVYEAPVGEIEQHIARVWQEVLKLEKVSRYDDFYRLGGHSLLALNVLGQLQRALNIQIPLATIIEFSELKTLAAKIEGLGSHVVTLSKAGETQKVPLTKAQQRMWLVQQLSPQSNEFNMFSALTLHGEINVERIETALRKVQTYHGALRTHLVEQAGEVLQQQMPADLSLRVLTGSLDYEQTLSQVKALVSEPLSLLNNSPVKACLIKQSDTQACLVFTVHHMFSDGLSMALIAESFEHFYHAEDSQLVEAPFHYSDYALTQSQDERTDDQALAWWRDYLEDAPEHHGLLLANPRTAKVTAAGHTLTQMLEGTTYQKLSELTSDLGISVFHLMHGLISQVVAQYSGENDVVIGSPMANRVHPDVENMVGLFLDTFVVRHKIDKSCSVAQWLKATAENCKEAMRHGQVGFEQIVSELNPNRGHHSPIFQIFINHLKQKEVVRDDTKRDFEISQFELPLEQAKYEVSFYVIEGNNGIELSINYKQDLIAQSAAQAYLTALIKLIGQVLSDSSQQIGSMFTLNDSDFASKPGETISLPHQNLYDWFRLSASKFADKQALTDAKGSVSYQQLDAQVNLIATSLQSRESAPERVLVYGKRNTAYIGAILACWKIGATAVPIDSDTPIQRAEYIYQDSAADFVLINDATCDFVPSEKQIHLVDILSSNSQQASDKHNLAIQDNTRNDNQVAYLVYTSGSTGKPKGVCGTHIGLINRLQWMHCAYPFTSENNVQITQSGFIRTLWETFLPLLAGNHVHILASDYYQDPEAFFNTLNALHVDRIVTTPTVVQSFSQYAKRANAVLPNLKYWFASGEAMSPEIANEALSSFADIQFVNLYGSTEVTSDVTHFPLDKNATYQSMRVGQAIANTSVYVVDEQNNKLPALAKGQVAIAGASLAEGYWQRADDSQRAFVELNGSTERAYLTGDYGVIDQTGQLQLLGRKDDLVNLGGYRCELKEIERAIQRLEHVEDACVIIKEGDTPYLAAYVASRFLSELATQQLTDFLLNAKKELNLWLPYYMLPKSIQVVSKFPVTANGKLDKKALLALSVSSLEESIEATTEVELLVSKVTGELLNLDKVDLARNFFELGGTSIQAAQLRNSIMSELEINLPLATVFNAVSLQSLTQEIEQQMKSQNLMEHLLSIEEDEADEEFII